MCCCWGGSSRVADYDVDCDCDSKRECVEEDGIVVGGVDGAWAAWSCGEKRELELLITMEKGMYISQCRCVGDQVDVRSRISMSRAERDGIVGVGGAFIRVMQLFMNPTRLFCGSCHG